MLSKRVFFLLQAKIYMTMNSGGHEMAFLVILGFLCVVFGFLKINIRFTYLKDGINDEIVVVFSTLHGLVSVKREINVIEMVASGSKPAMRLEEEMEVSGGGRPVKETGRILSLSVIIEKIRQVKEMIGNYMEAFRYITGKTTVRYFKWETGIGTGDAALTGIISGLLWNVKTIVIAFINRRCRILEQFKVDIKPDFERIALTTQFDCILSFKIGHAIIAGFKALKAKIKDGD